MLPFVTVLIYSDISLLEEGREERTLPYNLNYIKIYTIAVTTVVIL